MSISLCLSRLAIGCLSINNSNSKRQKAKTRLDVESAGISFFSTFSKIDCDELAHFLGELIIVFLV
jgi:hypothetical protein